MNRRIPSVNLILCPSCGSERVIALNFPQDVGVVLEEGGERPVAKCAVCGHRIYAQDVQNEAAEEPDPN
jgi:DNA-directed RNA polymerase subunit RPC12/RpoP